MIFAPVVAQPVDLEAKLRRAVLHGVVKLGVLEQRLGRDAAPVVARAAAAFLFHAGDFFAELRGFDCGDVAGRAGADDDEVVVGHEVESEWLKVESRAVAPGKAKREDAGAAPRASKGK